MKHKNKLKLALFCISVLLLTACNLYSTIKMPNPLGPAPTPAKAGILGYWSTECLATTGDKGYPLGYHYIKTYYFLSKNKLEVNLKLYQDDTKGGDTCSTSRYGDLLLTLSSTYSLGMVINKGSNNEHTNLNINTKQAMLLPSIQSIVDTFNSGRSIGMIYSGYGMTNWAKDWSVNVTGKANANKIFDIGIIVPDIFQVSTMEVNGQTIKVLKTGDMQGNLDQDGRPIKLNQINYKFVYAPY